MTRNWRRGRNKKECEYFIKKIYFIKNFVSYIENNIINLQKEVNFAHFALACVPEFLIESYTICGDSLFWTKCDHI
jgi:hypothetical protein